MTEKTADKGQNKDFLEDYRNTENQINDKIIKHLKVGDFPVIDKNFFLNIYNFVQQWGNKPEESEYLYNKFNEIIEGLTTEFKNQIHEKTTGEILEALIDRAKRMDILIYFLAKSFSFLDFYFTKSKKCQNLYTSALKI